MFLAKICCQSRGLPLTLNVKLPNTIRPSRNGLQKRSFETATIVAVGVVATSAFATVSFVNLQKIRGLEKTTKVARYEVEKLKSRLNELKDEVDGKSPNNQLDDIY